MLQSPKSDDGSRDPWCHGSHMLPSEVPYDKTSDASLPSLPTLLAVTDAARCETHGGAKRNLLVGVLEWFPTTCKTTLDFVMLSPEDLHMSQMRHVEQESSSCGRPFNITNITMYASYLHLCIVPTWNIVPGFFCTQMSLCVER